jgi:hypothetical protein
MKYNKVIILLSAPIVNGIADGWPKGLLITETSA